LYSVSCICAENKKSKTKSFTESQGSLTELQNQLLIARDIGYLKNDEFQKIAGQTIVINKLINELKRIKYTKY